jgi:hypothetical protein
LSAPHGKCADANSLQLIAESLAQISSVPKGRKSYICARACPYVPGKLSGTAVVAALPIPLLKIPFRWQKQACKNGDCQGKIDELFGKHSV